MKENNIYIDLPNNFNFIINKFDENSYEIIYPKNRYTFINLYSIFFEIFGMSVLTFLGIKFSYAGIFVAFIATFFFWYILIKQTIGNIIYIFEKQILTLKNDQFTLTKKLFKRCSITSSEISSIDSINLKNKSMSFKKLINFDCRFVFLFSTKQCGGTFDMPIINIGGKEIMFFETLKYKEQKWLVESLNDYINSFKQENYPPVQPDMLHK